MIGHSKLIVTVALPLNAAYPNCMRNLGNETAAQRDKRYQERDGKSKNEHFKESSVVGTNVADLIANAGFMLADATVQVRDGSRRVAVFTFEKSSRRAKSGCFGYLEELLSKRWGTSIVTTFTNKEDGATELVYHFQQECDETDRGTRLVEDPVAAEYGLEIHKKRNKVRERIAA